ncbi:MAG: PDZ domain-containing protein [Planctomycetota bacterium]
MKKMTLLLTSLLAALVASTAWAGEDEEKSFEIKKEITVKVEDGKMTIDTGDGPRVIDIRAIGGGQHAHDDHDHGHHGQGHHGQGHHGQGDHHAVHVDKLIRRVHGGDGAKVAVKGKMIMVDDKGNRHVVDLGEGEDEDVEFHWVGDHGEQAKQLKRRMKLPGHNAVVELMVEGDGGEAIFLPSQGGNHFVWQTDESMTIPQPSDYMVGIQLLPVSDLLRAQFGLDEGQGIGVGGVIAGSPAEEAGLAQFDVIVSANGDAVNGFQGLVDAVEQAGNGGDALTLSVMRRGDEISVEVTPVKRESDDDDADDDDDGDDDDDEDDSVSDVKAEIRELRAALKALRKELKDRD